jgi:hypothetical protein
VVVKAEPGVQVGQGLGEGSRSGVDNGAGEIIDLRNSDGDATESDGGYKHQYCAPPTCYHTPPPTRHRTTPHEPAESK